MGRPSSIVVPVELPRGAIGEQDPGLVAGELRVLWAIEQVRLQRCGVGKGAELAGLPRAAFMSLLGEHGIPVMAYDVDDWRQELSELDAR